MNAIEDLLDRARCSGIDHFTNNDLRVMREHLATLLPTDRVRAVYPYGDRIAETVIDRVWSHMGKKPSADDYRVMAELCREAAKNATTTRANWVANEPRSR